MNLSDFMIGAKALIEDESSWTTRWFARDADGVAVRSMDDKAVCFCSLGAIERFAGWELGCDPLINGRNLTQDAQELLTTVMGGLLVEEYNDAHTHKEVMAMWDEAIEVAKQAEA